jgi:hypothetical protein
MAAPDSYVMYLTDCPVNILGRAFSAGTIPMRLVFTIFALIATSCSQPQAATSGETPPYSADLDVAALMHHVMEPAAYDFWKGWGIILTAEQTIDISPRTEQEWREVENGAATVIAAANVLMTPGFARKPETDWYKAAQDLASVAKAGMDAAEKEDKQAMYDLGAKLDEACDACHDKFGGGQQAGVKDSN